MKGAQAPQTPRPATALRTTAGPMPAGSPIVMPTRGRRGAASRARSAGFGEASLIARSRNRVKPDEETAGRAPNPAVAGLRFRGPAPARPARAGGTGRSLNKQTPPP